MPVLSTILSRLPIRDIASDKVVGDSKRAAKIYNRESQTLYPALSHQFFAAFSINTGAGGYAIQQDLSFYIKSFDRPTVNVDVVELHQYNKRRLVQTGIKYGPVNVSFYDVNNRLLQLLFATYCRWYYGDFSAGKDGTAWDNDITTEFKDHIGGWGYTINGKDPYAAYFFDHIDLYDVSPDGSYVCWRMMHPLVESWTLGTDDYEQHTNQKFVNFTFKHEGIVIKPGHGKQGTTELDQQFRLSEFSEHAELPSSTKNFINDAISVTRDLSAGKFGNIAARFGLPLGGIITSIEKGKVQPTAIGADIIRIVKGSTALKSFGSFAFGDVAASGAGGSTSSGGVFGQTSRSIGLATAAALLPKPVVKSSNKLGTAGGTLSQVDEDGLTSSVDAENTQSTVLNPTVVTPQVEQSTDGRISLDLATNVSGTSAGVTNATGTELSKNYVNKLVSAGQTEFQPGIDTNEYQAAQGIVQTGRELPDGFRDALAGALVNASKRTGTPVSDMALVTKPSTSTTTTRTGSERELALTAQALREINRLKPASAQYGIKGPGSLNSNDPDARRILAAKR